jgi:protein-tyrosine sulfotransferase
MDDDWRLGAAVTFMLSPGGAMAGWSSALSTVVPLDLTQLSVLHGVAQGQSLASALARAGVQSEQASALVESLGRQGFLSHPGSESDERPIFVFGSPRSGTTLVRRILDRHPRIACGPESLFITGLRDLVVQGTFARQLANFGLSEPDLLAMVRGITERVHANHAIQKGKRRWADKTPAYVVIADFIHELFGDQATYLIVVRHGLDVAASIAQAVRDRFWGRNLAGFAVGSLVSDDPFESGARMWAHLNDRLYRFWSRHREDKNFHLVKYEDLVNQPASGVAALFSFLREETPAGFLEHLFDGPVETPSEYGGSGDYKIGRLDHIHTRSVGGWKNIPSGVVHSVADIVNPTLRLWGYEPV